MAMTNEQLTKWIDEIFGTIDEIKQNSGDISGLTRSVKQLREDVTDLEDQTAGTVSLPKAQLQHFTDGSATQALDLVADIIPVQAGTGDPSPTNVRAITGYSSVNVKTGGKNYWSNGNVSVSGAKTDVTLGIKITGKINISLSVTSNDTDSDTCALIFVYENGSTSSIYQFERGSRQSRTIDFGNNVVVAMSFYSSDNYTHGIGDSATWSNIQVEFGETATPYTAPDINTATISLGSTVYGGSVNFVTGELTITHKTHTINTIESYRTSSVGDHHYINFSINDMHSAGGSVLGDLLCDRLSFVEATGDHFGYYHTHQTIVICVTDDYSVQDFNTNIAGGTFVYDLATPITTTLTPAQLQLLQGENNVSATSGPITLTYAPDNVLAEVYVYIQKRFDTLTASLAANRTTRKTTKTLTKKED